MATETSSEKRTSGFRDVTPEDTMISYAQNAEDVLLWRVFSETKTGFYIDLGAADPVIGSITKVFYDRGWSGINVEPTSVFSRLAEARPRDVNLKLAVLDRTGDIDFVEETQDAGTSRVWQTSGGFPPPSEESVLSTVACERLDNIVSRHAGGRRINFLKIDVEGSEGVIIKATDWAVLRPQVLVVEAVSPWTNDLVSEDWEPRLLSAGYTRAYFDGVNLFFVRDEDKDLLRHFNRPVNVLDRFEKFDPVKAKLAEDVAALWRSNVELIEERDSLFNDRKKVLDSVAALSDPALIAGADEYPAVKQMKGSNDLLRASNAKLLAERDTLLEERNELLEILTAYSGTRFAPGADKHLIAQQVKRNIDALRRSSDSLRISNVKILAERDEAIDRTNEMLGNLSAISNQVAQIPAKVGALYGEAYASQFGADRASQDVLNALLGKLCPPTEGRSRRNAADASAGSARDQAQLVAADVRRELEALGTVFAVLMPKAARYDSLVHRLSLANGPRALKAVLPLARLLRWMSRWQSGGAASSNPLPIPVLHAQENLGARRVLATFARRILLPVYRSVGRPIVRPLAWRTRDFMLRPLHPLASQVDALTREVEAMRREIGNVQGHDGNLSPEFVKSLETLIFTLAICSPRDPDRR